MSLVREPLLAGWLAAERAAAAQHSSVAGLLPDPSLSSSLLTHAHRPLQADYWLPELSGQVVQRQEVCLQALESRRRGASGGRAGQAGAGRARNRYKSGQHDAIGAGLRPGASTVDRACSGAGGGVDGGPAVDAGGGAGIAIHRDIRGRSAGGLRGGARSAGSLGLGGGGGGGRGDAGGGGDRRFLRRGGAHTCELLWARGEGRGSGQGAECGCGTAAGAAPPASSRQARLCAAPAAAAAWRPTAPPAQPACRAHLAVAPHHRAGVNQKQLLLGSDGAGGVAALGQPPA